MVINENDCTHRAPAKLDGVTIEILGRTADFSKKMRKDEELDDRHG
jgi:hypothetical protein